MSVETERSSTEWSEESGLDYDETALTLRPPGGGAQEVEKKRGFSETGYNSDESPESQASAAEKPSAPKARVVGWPPVRAFRKNAMSNRNRQLIKVAVDGAPYLRKVDLKSYSDYDQLLTALQQMFSCFTIRKKGEEERKLVDPVNGTEYEPTYEDKDGDWMLVGDVPWKMFVESCKRLRLMKVSETAQNLGVSNTFVYYSYMQQELQRTKDLKRPIKFKFSVQTRSTAKTMDPSVTMMDHVKKRHHEKGCLYACFFVFCCCFCCYEACEKCFEKICCCGGDKTE
ncbi:hypothetical protein LUZ60_012290 [Juncus effusus]|nr:hypothetical protein LUZ60_012290 [Juncus effusus]